MSRSFGSFAFLCVMAGSVGTGCGSSTEAAGGGGAAGASGGENGGASGASASSGGGPGTGSAGGGSASGGSPGSSGAGNGGGAAGAAATGGAPGGGGAAGGAATGGETGSGGNGNPATGGNVGSGGAQALTCQMASAACEGNGKTTGCIFKNCSTQVSACSADCGSVKHDEIYDCLCTAQMGQGTQQACVSAFKAGGQVATDVVTCITTNCATECGL